MLLNLKSWQQRAHMEWVILSTFYSSGNTGEVWGTSSAIQGNCCVSDVSLFIYLWFFILLFKFRLAEKVKNKHFNVIADSVLILFIFLNLIQFYLILFYFCFLSFCQKSFRREWPSGLRHWDRIRKVLGIGAQPCYEAPTSLWVEHWPTKWLTLSE